MLQAAWAHPQVWFACRPSLRTCSCCGHRQHKPVTWMATNTCCRHSAIFHTPAFLTWPCSASIMVCTWRRSRPGSWHSGYAVASAGVLRKLKRLGLGLSTTRISFTFVAYLLGTVVIPGTSPIRARNTTSHHLPLCTSVNIQKTSRLL